MSLTAYRKHHGLTLEDCVKQFGFGSKGYWSDVENGAKLPIGRALEVELATNGEVPAASLLSPDDADLLAHHRRLSTAQPAEVAA